MDLISLFASARVGHLLWLFVAVVTHGVVGYALVRVLTPCDPVVGVIGGIIPDIDLFFHRFWSFLLVHRGLVHTPLFLAILLGGVALVDSPTLIAAGIGIAFLSHLVIDTFTKTGIMWLYPVSVHHFSYDISIHSFASDVVLWVASFSLVRVGGRDRLRQFGRR